MLDFSPLRVAGAADAFDAAIAADTLSREQRRRHYAMMLRLRYALPALLPIVDDAAGYDATRLRIRCYMLRLLMLRQRAMMAFAAMPLPLRYVVTLIIRHMMLPCEAHTLRAMPLMLYVMLA